MTTCPNCSAELRTDGINSWCVQDGCGDDATCAKCGKELDAGHDPVDLCPICSIIEDASRAKSEM